MSKVIPESFQDFNLRRHHHRVVPGNDLTANTNWLLECVSELLWRGRDRLAVDLIGPSSVVSQGGDRLSEVLADSHAEGLSAIPSLQSRNGFLVFFNKICQLEDQLASLGVGDIAPAGTIEGGSCSLYGLVDVFWGCGFDRDDFGLITA